MCAETMLHPLRPLLCSTQHSRASVSSRNKSKTQATYSTRTQEQPVLVSSSVLNTVNQVQMMFEDITQPISHKPFPQHVSHAKLFTLKINQ